MKSRLTPKLAVLWLLAALLVQREEPAAFAQNQASAANPLDAQEKAACARHLKQIYEGIQAYRKDHKDLPKWLSDLAPNYLADLSIFTCPTAKRLGKGAPYPHLADPKLATSYLYEFSEAEAGPIYQAGQMKMRELKRLQMGVLGGGVPILRCLWHEPALNVGFDGKFFESGLTWEAGFEDVVDPRELWPDKLLKRFGQPPPPATGPALEQKARQQSRLERDTMALVGQGAPNFELALLDGGRFELAAQKNKYIVILDFWATWCGPCRASLPELVQLSKDYQSKGVILKGVDLREEPAVIRSYLEKNNLSLSVLLDKKGTVAETYGVQGIPTTLVLAKDGSVQAVHIGYSPANKQRLRQELDQLVAGHKLKSPRAD